MSKGKYLEFHDLDSIVTIGSVRFNVYKNQIVGHIVQDTLNPDAQPIGDVTGRWMSPDPLSEEFPEWSPYTMVMDSPIRFNDPTGMAAEWTPDKNGNLIAEKGDNTKTLAKYLGTTTKDVSNRFTLTSTGKSLSEDHEFTEGSKVTLNNNYSRALVKSNGEKGLTTEEITNEGLGLGDSYSRSNKKTDSYNCTDGATCGVLGVEITPQNADLYGKGDILSFDSFLNNRNQFDKVSQNDAVFGKTIYQFGYDHAAVYYGTSKDGTVYVFSKNGEYVKPQITTLKSVESLYGNHTGIYNYNPKQ
ncbi:hypothetical protein NHF50_01055 [Flavobacterium sp. NRK F10]|uniref:hypothetical protein n=1 Tax=Flavobacterium sp. NRK F10 TaxID=2954931 RepID=UPI0020907B5C|nr:hypothetical protein [Flavobacterium sp. NRK F10]MCO6173624.1 hypothetical protein [Flavobacterium sp. NRK F10]